MTLTRVTGVMIRAAMKRVGGGIAMDQLLRKIVTSNSAYRILSKYGEMGVLALSRATPKESGETARSWSYEIEKTDSGYRLVWKNSHVNKGVPIAIILQYGHGTRNGGYVQGRDYINPALRPIFDGIAADSWKEMTSA